MKGSCTCDTCSAASTKQRPQVCMTGLVLHHVPTGFVLLLWFSHVHLCHFSWIMQATATVGPVRGFWHSLRRESSICVSGMLAPARLSLTLRPILVNKKARIATQRTWIWQNEPRKAVVFKYGHTYWWWAAAGRAGRATGVEKHRGRQRPPGGQVGKKKQAGKRAKSMKEEGALSKNFLWLNGD